MPNFYLDVPPNDPLSQGDIFLDFPVTMPLLETPSELTPEGDGLYRSQAAENGLHPAMVILATVEELSPVILLTQSCDARDANRLILAPLRPFVPRDSQPAKLWPQINDLANTLAAPTKIYLPDEPKFDFPRRFIDLGAPIAARRMDIERLATNGKRRATLSPDGLGYLQFRLTLLFSRFARDDYAWPSVADLELKKAALEKKIESQKQKIQVERGKLASPKTSSEETSSASAAVERLESQQARDCESLRLTEQALEKQKGGKTSPN